MHQLVEDTEVGSIFASKRIGSIARDRPCLCLIRDDRSSRAPSY